jgi:hypothetical protein
MTKHWRRGDWTHSRRVRSVDLRGTTLGREGQSPIGREGSVRALGLETAESVVVIGRRGQRVTGRVGLASGLG